VTIYLATMVLGWTVHDLAVRLGGDALVAGPYTSLFAFVLFGIPSLFMIGVVRLVEPKLPRWGFTLLAVLAALVPLLLAPQAPLLDLLLQTPAQVSLVVMLHLPGRSARWS